MRKARSVDTEADDIANPTNPTNPAVAAADIGHTDTCTMEELLALLTLD